MIVHIWCPQHGNWNGHWVVTNADGTICGVCNGGFTAEHSESGRVVNPEYTNHSTLYEQFTGYGGSMQTLNADGVFEHRGWKTAVMAVIDPFQMPNRI